MRRALQAAALALCLLGGTAVSQDILPRPEGADATVAQEPSRPISVVPEVEDEQLAGRLETILTTTGWFEDLAVSAQNGVVFLDGSTDRQEHRAWAEALAEKTQGSVAVVNRIAVRTDAVATFAIAWQELRRFFFAALGAWPVLLVAALILVAAWLVARLVTAVARRVLAPSLVSPLLLGIVARVLGFGVFLLGLYFVLQVAGLTRLAVTILGGTGLIGIVVGFAFRDIAENFLASMLLSIRNPFHTGDLIEVDGRTGIVQNLNTRTTVLLTLEGTHIQIPNATIYKSTIVNYSSNVSRRAEFVVGIGYDSSAAKAQALIAEVLKEHPAVLNVPEPLVLVDELGAATVNLRVFYWFDTATYSPAKINSAILRLSKNALLRGGIELPDPAREIIFPRGVPVIEQKSAAPRVTPGEGREAIAEDTSASTTGEGGLSNETKEVRSQSSDQIPEAAENLLKD